MNPNETEHSECRQPEDILRKWVQFPPRFLSHILRMQTNIVDDDRISGWGSYDTSLDKRNIMDVRPSRQQQEKIAMAWLGLEIAISDVPPCL